MRNKAYMMALMAATLIGGNDPLTRGRYYDSMSDEERKALLAKLQAKQREKRGVKEFHYDDDVVIFARDKKNADRKYKNLFKS